MMEELRQKDEELERMMRGEQEQQAEGLKGKLARRKELKKQRMQKLREKQMEEQMQLEEGHKNKIKEKRKQRTQEEVELVLEKLAEKYSAHEEGGLTLEDFIKMFEEVLNE